MPYVTIVQKTQKPKRDKSRLVKTLAGWSANTDLSSQLLSYEQTHSQTDVLAIAPYFYTDLKSLRKAKSVNDVFEAIESKWSRYGLTASIKQIKEQAQLAKEFGVEHDPSQLHGQNNDFRYRPRPTHVVRLKTAGDEAALGQLSLGQLALIALACQTTGCRLLVSSANEDDRLKAFVKATRCDFSLEDDQRWLESLATMGGASGRFLGPASDEELSVAVRANVSIVKLGPFANGRIELLNYLREQSISTTVHRYGNIFE